MGFYGQRAVLYLMDAATERFVLQPEGMGERDAGHVNLEDFYRANNITDPVILSMVADGVANRENVMFAHKVKGAEALCYRGRSATAPPIWWAMCPWRPSSARPRR